jgi:hypothetical protein
MSQQDLLLIIALAVMWWLSQQTPRRPYEPQGQSGWRSSRTPASAS